MNAPPEIEKDYRAQISGFSYHVNTNFLRKQEKKNEEGVRRKFVELTWNGQIMIT